MEDAPAANGIAASEMKQSPMIALTGAVSIIICEFVFKYPAEAMWPIGGTIPPTITAAMIVPTPSSGMLKLYQIHAAFVEWTTMSMDIIPPTINPEVKYCFVPDKKEFNASASNWI